MRVLFVTAYALPHIGGVEVVVDGLGDALRRRGHEVVHVSSDARRADDPPAEPHGAPVIRVRANNALESRLDVPYPVFGRGLARVLRDEVPKADVLNVHGFLYMGSILGLRRARRQPGGGPLRVLTEHVGHVDYSSPLLDRGEALAIATLGRVTARAAEGIVVLNHKVEAEMRRLAPGRTLATIPNGLDTAAYRPPDGDERARLRAELGWDERPRALFAGRLVAKKGIEVALDAARRAAGAFELVVVGPGSIAGELPRHVSVMGPLPRSELATLYRAADAFVLPSRGEGFPVTAQEAMASGLPVVLGDDPAYRPLVAGAGAGVRLAALDGGAVAAALSAILATPETRRAAGDAAAAHAHAEFGWQAAAERYERLFEDLRRARAATIAAAGKP